MDHAETIRIPGSQAINEVWIGFEVGADVFAVVVVRPDDRHEAARWLHELADLFCQCLVVAQAVLRASADLAVEHHEPGLGGEPPCRGGDPVRPPAAGGKSDVQPAQFLAGLFPSRDALGQQEVPGVVVMHALWERGQGGQFAIEIGVPVGRQMRAFELGGERTIGPAPEVDLVDLRIGLEQLASLFLDVGVAFGGVGAHQPEVACRIHQPADSLVRHLKACRGGKLPDHLLGIGAGQVAVDGHVHLHTAAFRFLEGPAHHLSHCHCLLAGRSAFQCDDFAAAEHRMVENLTAGETPHVIDMGHRPVASLPRGGDEADRSLDTLETPWDHWIVRVTVSHDRVVTGLGAVADPLHPVLLAPAGTSGEKVVPIEDVAIAAQGHIGSLAGGKVGTSFRQGPGNCLLAEAKRATQLPEQPVGSVRHRFGTIRHHQQMPTAAAGHRQMLDAIAARAGGRDPVGTSRLAPVEGQHHGPARGCRPGCRDELVLRIDPAEVRHQFSRRKLHGWPGILAGDNGDRFAAGRTGPPRSGQQYGRDEQSDSISIHVVWICATTDPSRQGYSSPALQRFVAPGLFSHSHVSQGNEHLIREIRSLSVNS